MTQKGLDLYHFKVATAAAAGVNVELKALILESDSEKREGYCKGAVPTKETDERDDAGVKVGAGEVASGSATVVALTVS